MKAGPASVWAQHSACLAQQCGASPCSHCCNGDSDVSPQLPAIGRSPRPSVASCSVPQVRQFVTAQRLGPRTPHDGALQPRPVGPLGAHAQAAAPGSAAVAPHALPSLFVT